MRRITLGVMGKSLRQEEDWTKGSVTRKKNDQVMLGTGAKGLECPETQLHLKYYLEDGPQTPNCQSLLPFSASQLNVT